MATTTVMPPAPPATETKAEEKFDDSQLPPKPPSPSSVIPAALRAKLELRASSLTRVPSPKRDAKNKRERFLTHRRQKARALGDWRRQPQLPNTHTLHELEINLARAHTRRCNHLRQRCAAAKIKSARVAHIKAQRLTASLSSEAGSAVRIQSKLQAAQKRRGAWEEARRKPERLKLSRARDHAAVRRAAITRRQAAVRVRSAARAASAARRRGEALRRIRETAVASQRLRTSTLRKYLANVTAAQLKMSAEPATALRLVDALSPEAMAAKRKEHFEQADSCDVGVLSSAEFLTYAKLQHEHWTSVTGADAESTPFDAELHAGGFESLQFEGKGGVTLPDLEIAAALSRKAIIETLVVANGVSPRAGAAGATGDAKKKKKMTGGAVAQ